MEFLLPFLFFTFGLCLLVWGIVDYQCTTKTTGETRLVKNGMEYEIEAKCTWFFRLFTCWRKLARFKALPHPMFSYSDELSSKPYSNDGMGHYKVAKFDTKEQAEQAVIDWRTNKHLKEKIHQEDGPKEKLTNPVS